MADEKRITQESKKTVILSDGKKYEIKPLSLKDTKAILPLIGKVDKLSTEGMTDELIDAMAEVCKSVLSRKHPELTKDKILELVEVSTVQDIIAKAMGMGK